MHDEPAISAGGGGGEMRLSRALSEAEQRVLLRCAVGASGEGAGDVGGGSS